jgi:hypothetical protein
MHYVSYGSWLCENAKLLDDDRRSYSSKTALGHQLAIAFNFKIELKNVILVAFRTFAFLHSQGQSRHFERPTITSGLPPQTDINRPARLVRFVPHSDSCSAASFGQIVDAVSSLGVMERSGWRCRLRRKKACRSSWS